MVVYGASFDLIVILQIAMASPMFFLLAFLVVFIVFHGPPSKDTMSNTIEEETKSAEDKDQKSTRRGLRIAREDEFSKYRQEPLTIPPPLSHTSSKEYSSSNTEKELSEHSDAELDHYHQHHRYSYSHGHGHKQDGLQYQHGAGVGAQHFDAELNNDVSSFHHLDHSSDVESVPVKPRKFRPRFPVDESSAHGARMKIHPRHRHHPIKASFDEFDGHTGEYVRSGHATSVSSVTNVLPS